MGENGMILRMINNNNNGNSSSNEVVIDGLQSKSKCSKSVNLTWRNIVVYPPEKKTPLVNRILKKNRDFVNKPYKLIIDNVDGIAKSNEVLAIMGASGAGKTSLLNVLNFRNRGLLKIEGEVRVNGHLIRSVEEIASISGYVQQDDLFVGSLTVKENLIFQAMLRMDSNYTMNERMQRVEDVLKDLNLKKCENTTIFIQDQKGISGGEKRRLAFASEVLTNPLILFCDEPTSGLDSFMALSVVECMKNLASQGRTIICTIHQPSSEIFDMFDKLCLLAEGRLAFIGSLKSAYTFFDNQGYTVPYNYNPGDFYIKNLAVIPSDREASIERIEKICSGFNKDKRKQDLVEEIDNINEKNYSPEEMIDFKQEIKYKTNFITQMRWLLWRNMLSLSRNPMALRVQIVQAVLIAFIFGCIYFQLNLNQKGVQNIAGVLFLCVTNNSFGSMFIVINTFPAEIPLFIREHENRMYRCVSYYLARVLLDIPLYFLIPTIFMSIVYWMTNLNNDIGRFFIAIAMVILVAQASLAFGTFLSSCVPSVNVALSLAGPSLIPFMIFSGFLLNAEDVPRYFLPLRYLSWFSYTNENLLVNQFQGIEHLECDDPSEECFKRFSNGNDVIDFFKADPTHFNINILCTILIVIGWRILAFIVLLFRSQLRK